MAPVSLALTSAKGFGTAGRVGAPCRRGDAAGGDVRPVGRPMPSRLSSAGAETVPVAARRFGGVLLPLALARARDPEFVSLEGVRRPRERVETVGIASNCWREKIHRDVVITRARKRCVMNGARRAHHSKWKPAGSRFELIESGSNVVRFLAPFAPEPPR